MTAAILDSHPGKPEQSTLVDMVFRSTINPWGIGCFRREDGTLFCVTSDFGKTVLYEEFILYGERLPDIEGGDFEVSQFTSYPPRSINAISDYLAALTVRPQLSSSRTTAKTPSTYWSARPI